MARLDFLRTAMKDLARTGSVWESSPSLIKKLLAPVDWSAERVIVELGTGNGVITRAILRKMSPDARLTAYEINPEFLELTRTRIRKDPRCLLSDASAEDLVHWHLEGSVDVVISSLPFAIMDEGLQETILGAIREVLRPDGLYIQYQYAPTQYRMITRRFRRVRMDYTLWNLPPAFVYVCRK